MTAAARDATRLEPLVQFFFCFHIYYTNVFLGSLDASKQRWQQQQQQGLETRHVSSFWYVFICFSFFYYTNVSLGPLNMLKWRWQQQQQQQRQGLETRHVSSRWYVFLFLFYYTNVYFRSSMQCVETAMAAAAEARDANVSSPWFLFIYLYSGPSPIA